MLLHLNKVWIINKESVTNKTKNYPAIPLLTLSELFGQAPRILTQSDVETLLPNT